MLSDEKDFSFEVREMTYHVCVRRMGGGHGITQPRASATLEKRQLLAVIAQG